jgi:hypothetical protein
MSVLDFSTTKSTGLPFGLGRNGLTKPSASFSVGGLLEGGLLEGGLLEGGLLELDSP